MKCVTPYIMPFIVLNLPSIPYTAFYMLYLVFYCQLISISHRLICIALNPIRVLDSFGWSSCNTPMPSTICCKLSSLAIVCEREIETSNLSWIEVKL